MTVVATPDEVTFQDQLNGLPPSCRFWGQKLAPLLARMVRHAGYKAADQAQILSFFLKYVVPSYGPPPGGDGKFFWESWITHDHTPSQFSFNFHRSKCTVRMSNLPTDSAAGTPRDPFNERGTTQTVAALGAALPGVDLAVFEYLAANFIVPEEQRAAVEARQPMPGFAHMLVACMLGYDFEPTPRVKVYFCPLLRSLQLEVANHDLIWQVIHNGHHFTPYHKALALLHEAGNPRDQGGWVFHPQFVSIDLVDRGEQSRLKLYGFTTNTSWSHIRDIYTLGGRFTGPEIDRGLTELKALWYSTLSVPEDYPEHEDLPLNPHPVAGVIYNYELREDAAFPEAKVYVPVRFYGGTQDKIVTGLENFFSRQGWTDLAESYRQDFTKLFSTDDGKLLAEHHDVSFSWKNSEPYVTVYYKPEVLQPLEW